MGKFKKFRAEFKEQSLLEKIRIIFVSILLVAVVVTAGIVGLLFALDWGSDIVHRHTVKKTQPISDTYSLRTYKDGSYQLVVTEHQRKIGPRFYTMRDDMILSDSVIILYGGKGCLTFSLKTGAFSEEYFDNIGTPDTLHHLAACSRKGLLGFVNVHSGKLVIQCDNIRIIICSASMDQTISLNIYFYLRAVVAVVTGTYGNIEISIDGHIAL